MFFLSVMYESEHKFCNQIERMYGCGITFGLIIRNNKHTAKVRIKCMKHTKGEDNEMHLQSIMEWECTRQTVTWEAQSKDRSCVVFSTVNSSWSRRNQRRGWGERWKKRGWLTRIYWHKSVCGWILILNFTLVSRCVVWVLFFLLHLLLLRLWFRQMATSFILPFLSILARLI